MSELRDKKKKAAIERITKAARELLINKGYADATIEEIAENAEVGTGTLYNYFSSKAELFLSLMTEELHLEDDDFKQFKLDLEKDAADSVVIFLKKSFGAIRLFKKSMWRELFAAMFANSKPDNLIFKVFRNSDNKTLSKLEQLFETMKSKNLLLPSFKSKEAAYAVFSVVITQTLLFAYTESISTEEFERNIETQIRFIFENKYI